MIAMMRVSSFLVMVMKNLTQNFVSALRACRLKMSIASGTLVMN
jgi:hypothetical protein